MKLEDVKEEIVLPPKAKSDGVITIMSGGKRVVMSMDDFHAAMDPVTGTLSREFWGEGIESRIPESRRLGAGNHLGAVRDDC